MVVAELVEQKLYETCIVNCLEKTKITEKEAGNGAFKTRFFAL